MNVRRSMSDEGLVASRTPPGDGHAAGGATAGMLLRHAREAAGVHISALAAALKVPVKKIEALESDQLDQLPDAVFARALASSVCRTLKVDPAPVLRLLPGQVTPPLQLDPKVSNPTFSTPGMGWHLPLVSRVPRPVLVVASLLVLAALALLLFPSLSQFRPAPVKLVPAGNDAARPNPVAVSEVPSAVKPAVPSPSLPALADVVVTPASSAPATLVAPPASPVAASPSPAPPDAESAAGAVVFKTRAPSWVQVTDAAGAVLFSKTMAADETAGVSGAMPLSVTVGRSDAIDVRVRGKVFDLASVSKDNVARFQVK